MKNRRRFLGQSLVEFALIFPVLFFMITGFLDIGRAVFYYSSLSNAVREATRHAIVNKADLTAALNNPTNNPLQNKVLEYAFALTGTSHPLTRANIIVTPQRVNNLFTTVTIQATYTYRPVTPGITQLLGSGVGINLTARSKMQVSPIAK